MKDSRPSRKRCAIYTRKSTEHNLDLAFNSLDAQREACEAYIKSQAHEGWTLVCGRFDDGGLSGASLERPALRKLLEEVKACKIDVVVVYKVDRLTRSLADFAKLVELFDANDVSFVSVTQSFNTTSSMGRLTLNVLLSFAQFEREVIGERVRDKIAASKRKGIWVGGPIPLGYRSVAKVLEVVPEDADLVRKIFAGYSRAGSIADLAASLEREGVRPRPRQLTNGKVVVADRFMVGPLAHILKNRFYVGEVAYRGEIHPGSHAPIVDRDLFQAVQAKLQKGAVSRRQRRLASSSLLTGQLYDDRGNSMTPSHTNKGGVRYRYYVSQALLQGQSEKAGELARVPAPDIEEVIIGAIRRAVEPGPISDQELVRQHLEKAVVARDKIIITLTNDGPSASVDPLVVPFRPKLSPRKGAHEGPGHALMDEATSRTLLTAIARSRRWIDEVQSGAAKGFEEIARREQLVERHIRFLAPLAYLSPTIVSAIAECRAPANLTVSALARALPLSWADQERRLGLG